jgi:hypothetical protein
MLELQKITEFAKPTKLDRFKKHIKTQSNLDKEIKSFDFFKTSRTQKKKTLLGNIYFFVIAFIYLNACVGVILDMSNKDPISVEIDKTYEIYQKISNNLDEKNVIDIDSYYKLKSLPDSRRFGTGLCIQVYAYVWSVGQRASRKRTSTFRGYI